MLHGAGLCTVLWQGKQSFGAGWHRRALPDTPSVACHFAARPSRRHMFALIMGTWLLTFSVCCREDRDCEGKRAYLSGILPKLLLLGRSRLASAAHICHQNIVRQSLIVQDFGKVLARYVTVFNCSAGVDLRTFGRILAGLAQTGAWACLEELSRVPADVLSIVAAQIGSLMQVGDFCLRQCGVVLMLCSHSAVQ